MNIQEIRDQAAGQLRRSRHTHGHENTTDLAYAIEKMCGVRLDPMTLLELERGDGRATMEVFVVLADYYMISIEELLAYSPTAVW